MRSPSGEKANGPSLPTEPIFAVARPVAADQPLGDHVGVIRHPARNAEAILDGGGNRNVPSTEGRAPYHRAGLGVGHTLHRDAETLSRHHGAKLVVRLQADYMFPNCPRYIPALTEAQPSPHNPVPGHAPPAPQWKSRDYIRNILPKDDPHRGS